MNLLAIETSSPVLSVAVKRSEGRLRHAKIQGFMKHAENLLPVIDRLLKKENLSIREIDAFLIGRGPGSFTGLRIGFATLKGFLALSPKPCCGAFSLDVIAAEIHPKGFENLTVCLDAGRDRLYTRSYYYRGQLWQPSEPPHVIAIEDLKLKLSKKNLLAGNGIRRFDVKGFALALEKSWMPRASALITLFEKKSPLLKKMMHPKELLPVYLRRSGPEEKFAERERHA